MTMRTQGKAVSATLSTFRGACLAALALTLGAAPAAAFEPDADMGYAFELHQVGVGAAPGAVGFSAFMHTLTLTDRTGMVLALVNSAAQTNANRYWAEQDAIRKDQLFYTYQQVIDEPKEGVRLGLTLGTGSPGGFSGPGLTAPTDLDAKLVRLRMETDMFPLLGGTTSLHFGGSYFRAAGRSGGGSFELSTFMLPLGLAWRIAPLPVNGLVFEPFVDVDWGNAIVRGFGSLPAHDYGLRVAYYPHRSVAFVARAEAAALSANGSFGWPKFALADVKIGSLGAQLLF